MQKVTAKSGQTVIDLAMQYLGGIDLVFEILDANESLVLDQSIPAGTIVYLPEKKVNKAVAAYYADNDIVPVSGLGEDMTIIENDMNTVQQDVNYNLAGGDREFDRVQLFFLRDLLTVQVRYSDLDKANVVFAIDQSLDGQNWTEVPYCTFTLDPLKDTHTFNIVGILTNFVRGHIRTPESTTGTIDHIIFKT